MTRFDTLKDLLDSRQSCRAFTDAPVDRAEIDAVLCAAQRVPSWCNSQPWQVIACGADETARLAQDLYAHALSAGHVSDIPFPARYEGAYKERRSACGWQLYEAVGIERGDRAGSARQMMENFRLFGAQTYLIVTTPKALGPYGVLDCGAFVTAVLLGLEAKGLGAIAMASVAGYAPFLRDRYGVAEDRDIVCGIAIGHPNRAAPVNGFRTDRAAEDEVVDWR